jgi:predicted Zn-dependent protease
MPELSPADLHCVRAAEGWFELGNAREAEAELDKLATPAQLHPVVSELRWQIFAQQKRWQECVLTARAITRNYPAEPLGWIHLSYALHELKRTQEAWDNLIAVVEDFPKEPTMRYNLACYACQLGDLPAARRWLKKTFALGRKKETKLMALQDADLQPLWPEIGGM